MDPERVAREREFFDRSSGAQADTAPPPLTEHVGALLGMLGEAAGLRVLDCGAGAGELAIPLAERGARVVAFDLSEESLRLMRTRAGAAAPAPIVAAMESLPFPDGAFDAVVGKSILHHVEVAPAMAEVRRVLTPGGRALFVENQVTNPLLRFARRRLTGRFGVARVGTLDEHPLVRGDYQAIRRLFPDTRLTYPDFRFFGLVSRNVLRYRRAPRAMRTLAGLDRFVERRLPAMRRWGYHVILDLRKR